MNKENIKHYRIKGGNAYVDNFSFDDLDSLYDKINISGTNRIYDQNGIISIDDIIEQESEKIISKILYYAHPFRLFLKSLNNFRNKESITNEMKRINYREEIINDIISQWNELDNYGLMMLCKMNRLVHHWIPQVGFDSFKTVNESQNVRISDYLVYKLVYYLFNISLHHNLDVKQTYNASVNLLDVICQRFESNRFDEVKELFNKRIVLKLNLDVLLLFNVKLMLKYNSKIYKDKLMAIVNKLISKLKENNNDESKELLNKMTEWSNIDEPHELRSGGGGRKSKK
jgi:hypothetical protein